MNEKVSMFDFLMTDEVIDRCLAAASRCLNLGNDSTAKTMMKAEFRELAREVAQWELSGETKADLFLIPMEEELIGRHGQPIGRQLYFDFVDAFWIQTWTDDPLELAKLERNVILMMDWHQRSEVDRSWRRAIVMDHLGLRVGVN